MRTNKIQWAFCLLAVLALGAAPMANADDRDDVEAVINQYIDSEGFDLAEQTKLMASDRTYIFGGMRYSNNDKSMALQTAGNAVITTAQKDVVQTTTPQNTNINGSIKFTDVKKPYKRISKDEIFSQLTLEGAFKKENWDDILEDWNLGNPLDKSKRPNSKLSKFGPSKLPNF